MLNRVKSFIVALFGLAFVGLASAQVDATAITTAGTGQLTSLLTDAMPYIAAAIALAIGLRWVRKVFKF